MISRKNFILFLAILTIFSGFILFNIISYEIRNFNKDEISSNSLNASSLNEINENAFFTTNAITGALVLDSNSQNLPQPKSLPQPKLPGTCSICNPNNKEVGDESCECDEWEHCLDFTKKSTAYNYDREGETATDYCTSTNVLREFYIDCYPYLPLETRDKIFYTDKNCDDFNTKGNWEYYCSGNYVKKYREESDYNCLDGACVFSEEHHVDDQTVENCNSKDAYGDWQYFCTDTAVKKRRPFYDYTCSSGACALSSTNYVDEQTIISKGGDGYCSKRQEYNCELCGDGDWDCAWSDECAGSLVCSGYLCIFGGSECGCCESGETWETINNKCCECSSGDGVCCDGCNFRDSSYVCATNNDYTYSCKDGNCLGDDVYRRNTVTHCSGSSSKCEGSTSGGTPIVVTSCSTSEFCDGTTAWKTNQIQCADAECTSGECCDATCGDYKFKPSSTKCSESIEYSCSGENLGDNVLERTKKQFCPGTTSSCSGSTTFTGWSTYLDCSSNEYCHQQQCVKAGCTKNSECGTNGYTGGKYCKNNNVFQRYRTHICDYVGTKDARCSYSDSEVEVETCGYGCSNGACKPTPPNCSSNPECGRNNYTGEKYCKNSNVWQKYRTYICSNPGTAQSSCGYTDSENQTETCLNGCENGICKASVTCSNDNDCKGKIICPQVIGGDTPRCNSTSNICYCGGACNKPDLTVTDLVIQSVRDKNITLAFTIKNIGNAATDKVYWMVNTDSGNQIKRTSPISLNPGKWTRAYMMWTYSNAGSYTTKVIVDSDNLVDESDENNNQISFLLATTLVNQCQAACTTGNIYGYCGLERTLIASDLQTGIKGNCSFFSTTAAYQKYGVAKCPGLCPV